MKMTEKILSTIQKTYTKEEYKNAKTTFLNSDSSDAISAAIKSALKYQRPYYVFGVYYKGWRVAYKKPSLPYGYIFYEIVPTGELSVTGNKIQIQ